MTPTKEQTATAKALAKTHKADKIFVNSKGEFFTDYHNAHASVGGKPSEFTQVDLNSKDGEEQLAKEPELTEDEKLLKQLEEEEKAKAALEQASSEESGQTIITNESLAAESEADAADKNSNKKKGNK